MIRRELLATASYRELTTEVRLANGAGTGYALGLDVELKSGKRILRHGGEVGGFTAENRIYPDDGIAIVVLTNQDATDASSTIADGLAALLLLADSPSQAVDLGGAIHGQLPVAFRCRNAPAVLVNARVGKGTPRADRLLR